ncbi:hypothetical protein HPC49_17885 [Pyxidicoccus fallax]|uniref:Type II secretion system protein GspG C-terminal domain-containing protein n=1 Tax=Pyxidicoccus fallax TaxID=394095 RepID=A0A848LHL7_9BACT|nr:type II secretion system protein GspG [Pyxidicoccus fallax]NMO16108.1 hypothetical protein [Pyxidicoccus fallax]NPC80082.1 hypothetical protein [Pyxidicoccus fallax]
MTPRRSLRHSLRQAAKVVVPIAGCYVLLQLAANPFCGHPFTTRSPRERAMWDLGVIMTSLRDHARRTGPLPLEGGWPALVDVGVVEEVPVDPWGRPYTFSVAKDGQVEVSTLGADGQPGGDGADKDIVRAFTMNTAKPPSR